MKISVFLSKFLVLLLSVFLLSAFCLTAWGKDWTLTQNGKTDYSILTPETPTPVEVTAFQELQSFLKQITGVDFPIVAEPDQVGGKVISVGKTAYAQRVVDFDAFKQDEILLQTQADGSLILAGHAQRGTLYAVYTLLEDYLNVRWWTANVSYVPENRNLSVPTIDYRYAPSLIYRESFHYVGFPGVFAARSKMNGASERIPAEYGGHSNYLYFVHSFEHLIPIQEFKEHPDWFPEIDGVRKVGYPGWTGQRAEIKEFLESLPPENVHSSGTQLCLANEELCQVMTERVLEKLREDPSYDIVSISQNDWYGYCTCEKCRALDEAEGTPAASMINFVNKVAEGIEKEFPNIWVDTLAYQYTRKPPKTIKPRHNVIVRLCSIECSFLKPLTDEVNKSFREDIENWSRISPQLFIWDYVSNFSNYLQPHPNLQVLGANIRFFIDNKTIGLFEEGDYHTTVGDFIDARNWVISHLLWNPDLDEEQLWNEFLNGYYGAAGPYLKQYLDTLQAQALASDVYLTCFMQNTNKWLDFQTANKAQFFVNKAREAVKDDPVLKNRVDIALVSWDLTCLTRYLEFKSTADKLHETWLGELTDPLQTGKDLFEFIERQEAYRHNEGGWNWEGYKNGILDQLKVIPTTLTIPDECKDLPLSGWLDIQDFEFRLHKPGECANIVGDSAASNGVAVQMPGNHVEWATAWDVTDEVLDLESISGKTEDEVRYHVYVYVRADATAKEGDALTLGLYDSESKAGLVQKTVSIEEIAGSEYHKIDLGAWPLKKSVSLWVAPVNHPDDVQAVYTDRILVICE